eukprot:TRINITY_DN783_c0_g1_i1.p1 TRINITY_DN783_c0_g1~~TRINITY_DN783_c0_g1_i1.p1  ORF type:complete len:340 (-),score=116.58 TRINITY_DN783_c0_g1_i1:20-1039(-)
MAKVIFGIGNPLLDISVEVNDDSLLDKYGLRLNNAILVAPEHEPIFDDLMAMENKLFIAGGACSNSIRAAQWMHPEENMTHFAGCVGQDDAADILVQNLTSDGVAPHMKISDGVPTGRCACVIKGKERSLAAWVSAAKSYTPDHLEQINDVLSQVDIIYTTGFFLDSSSESATNLAKFATENNKTFCVNISAEFVAQFYGEPLAVTIEHANFVFCNETEAVVYAKSIGLETEDLREIAQHIAGLPFSGNGHRTAIITCGSEETIYAFGETIAAVPVDPIASELIVDTNGAGDSFVGGFLAGLSLGKDLETSIRAGHYCAGYTIQRSGTNFSSEKSAFEW